MHKRQGFAFVQERLAEGSTWRGFVALLMAFGLTLDPDQVAAIVAAGAAIGGLIGVFFKERDSFYTRS